ncbi:MAG: peptidoglycan bridge formation glycyltransferase FemA/FemB family protein [Candidatus Vogelbacteria bacterium]
MNDLIFRALEETELFDPLTLCSDAPFTQARFYGQWQTSLDRAVKRFVVSRDNQTVAFFQLIKYQFFNGKSYFYLPYGPVTKDFSEDFFAKLKQELNRLAKTENAVFVRLDFTPPVSNAILSKFFTQAPFYTYHSAHFQPRREWCLDLGKSEDELLAVMHEKTRYSIRLAERKGIIIEIITENFEKYFENFYELMSGTAQRNGFNLHQKNYYKNIFQNLQTNNAYLVIAKYGEKVLVIKLIICYGPTAYSVFSGSSNDYRDLRPTYLVQWTAICQAKKLGHHFYNFGGISAGKIYRGWDGLTVFKKNFGGAEIIHSDFFDIVVQPFWYRLYNFRKLTKSWGRG